MNRAERASQIWAVLAWVAKNRQSLTYGQLAKLIGVPTAGLGQLLEPIQSYCKTHKLPPLTILVVQQESGLPGPGFTGATATEFAREQAKVLAKDWLECGNPQPEKLELAVQQLPTNGPRDV
jgi:alkylated DNA nucleotide flippase Atl1